MRLAARAAASPEDFPKSPAVGEKMAHVYGSCSSSKQSNGVKERRECQDPLRFRQPTSENALQDNASHQSYESKRLADARQQLGAIIVFCGPRTGVLGAENSRQGCACQPSSEDQPRIHPATQ